MKRRQVRAGRTKTRSSERAATSLHGLDRKAIRAALEAARGITSRAAEELGIPRTTLQKWLLGPLRGWRDYFAKLKKAHAPQAQGRPWKESRNRSRQAVARAWRAAGYQLSGAARLLNIPRTSLRHLLYRYKLPNLPANGRKNDLKNR
jgi:DNA-binding NtrC family response regulator